MRHSPSIDRRAPIVCAASSMTGSPGSAVITSSIGAIWPKRSTGMHGLGPRGPRSGRRVGQDVERLGVDVDEHRLGADVVDRPGRGEERERRRDDLVAPARSPAPAAPAGARRCRWRSRRRTWCATAAATSRSSSSTGSTEDEQLRVDELASSRQRLHRGSWRAGHADPGEGPALSGS